MLRTIASVIADLDEKSPEREGELMHGDASAKSEPSSCDRVRRTADAPPPNIAKVRLEGRLKSTEGGTRDTLC